MLQKCVNWRTPLGELITVLPQTPLQLDFRGSAALRRERERKRDGVGEGRDQGGKGIRIGIGKESGEKGEQG